MFPVFYFEKYIQTRGVVGIVYRSFSTLVSFLRTFSSCFCGQLELQTPKLPPQWSGEPRIEKREPRPRLLLLKQRRRHSLLDKAQWTWYQLGRSRQSSVKIIFSTCTYFEYCRENYFIFKKYVYACAYWPCNPFCRK